jgi:hypothetical protein
MVDQEARGEVGMSREGNEGDVSAELSSCPITSSYIPQVDFVDAVLAGGDLELAEIRQDRVNCLS